MRALLLFSSLVWMCESPAPELPCGNAEGMLIEWTLDGTSGSACWDETSSGAVIDESRAIVGMVTEEQNFGIGGTSGEPLIGSVPPCAYNAILVWETGLSDGASGSVTTTDSVHADGVSEVLFRPAFEDASGTDCVPRLTPTGGTWRVWEGGTWGEPLLLELRDLTYPSVDGHTLTVRRVLWRGTITPTPVRLRPGVDAGTPDAS